MFEAVERRLARIDARDLRISRAAERELRRILRTLRREIEYRRLAGVLRVDFASPQTRRARTKALRDLEKWKTETQRKFALPGPMKTKIRDRILLDGPEAALQAGITLEEMGVVLDRLSDDWTRLIRRITKRGSNGRLQFTAKQIAEAKQLSVDTAFFRRRFPSVRAWLEEQGVEASFGKIENLAALVETTRRQVRNAIVGTSFGAPLNVGGVGFSTARESRREDFLNIERTLGFNENVRKLSSVSHVRGLYNSGMARLAQALGVSHFMFIVPRRSRARLDPRGVSATELFQVRLGEVEGGAIGLMTFADRVAAAVGRPVEEVLSEARTRATRGEPGRGVRPRAANVRRALARMLASNETIRSWPARFEQVNAGRRTTVAWGGNLPIHPGSGEYYLPIPPELLAGARAYSRRRREEIVAVEDAA